MQTVNLPMRVGHGFDLHRLQPSPSSLTPSGRLVLAGVEVSTQLGPIAHTDGDVILHAAVDALLGAIGVGDIGEHFPNTDPKWKGAASSVFVRHAIHLVKAAGYVVGNIDVLVLADWPKLQPFKPQMRANLAQLLGVDVSQVNIKAGTNEGCDAIGHGEAIAAHATVLLLRQ